MLLNSLVLLNGIWQMQLFQINQSEDSSKITIMYDNPSGQLHQRSITTAPTLYRAAGKNQTFMFFVAVIHSEQHTIYVVTATDKKVQLVSPFFRTYRNNLIENLEGYRGIEECLGCSAC